MTITEAHERAMARFTIHNADITPQFLAEIVDAYLAAMEAEGFVMAPVDATANMQEAGPRMGIHIPATFCLYATMIAARPRVTP